MPCSRSQRIAFSMSPFDSVRAFLHSIMPTPVFSRSSFTWPAEMFILFSLRCQTIRFEHPHACDASDEDVRENEFLLLAFNSDRITCVIAESTFGDFEVDIFFVKITRTHFASNTGFCST